jgi:hypothetical protein
VSLFIWTVLFYNLPSFCALSIAKGMIIKMQRFILKILIILVVFILARSLYLYVYNKNNIAFNLNRIIKKYGTEKSCSYFDIEANKFGQENLVLEYDMNFLLGFPKEPKELYALFESLLYLQEVNHDIPSMAKLKINFGKASSERVIIISKTEFYELYNEGFENLSSKRKEKAIALSNLWANKYFYNRYRLNLAEDKQVYYKLLTNYSSYYTREIVDDSDSATFLATEWGGLVIEFGYRKDEKFTILEMLDYSTFFFGQWGVESNFWFYDKQNGLTVVKVLDKADKNFCILKPDEVDLSKMPTPFDQSYSVHVEAKESLNGDEE